MTINDYCITPHFEIVRNEYRAYPDVEIKVPVRGTDFSAACDFFSPTHVVIKPGESIMIWSDLKAIINTDEALLLLPRSSLGSHNIMLANTMGVIDADYANNVKNDGNIGFCLHNYGTDPYEINIGDKLVQGLLIRYHPIGNESNQIRQGGFGSTGK